MVSLPFLWFLLSIDLNRYVGTCLGTEGTADAKFRSFHVDNVVPALVVVGRIGQHVLGTESNTQAAAFTPLLINYYCSFWHVCALSKSMQNVCCCSSVPPRREPAPGWMITCLWRFVNVLCAAAVYVSSSCALTTRLQRSNNARDFSLIVAQVKSDSVRTTSVKLSKWCSHSRWSLSWIIYVLPESLSS